MSTGLGFFEILLILTVVLIFFGSKEIPRFIREIARIMAVLRKYSDKIRREFDDAVRVDEIPVKSGVNIDKQKIRENFISIRRKLPLNERKEKSVVIYEYLKSTEVFNSAASVMIYVSTGSEVATREAIRDMINIGKRVVVPYCIKESRNLGIAEICDIDNDLVTGSFGIPEPQENLKDRFFKSDIQLILCPGVAFDMQGGRMGRGKSFYDNFLREFKGRIPVWGLAFNCQVRKEPFPFDYHDIAMDQVVTENGFLLPRISKIEQVPAG